jgi:DNA-binding transcriptional LysR family regulator
MQVFGHKYPAIEVRVFEGIDRQVVTWLQDRSIDIGFVTPPNEALDTIQIAEDQFVAVLPEGHPLANKTGVQLAEIAAEPFILSAGVSSPLIEEVFRSAELRLNLSNEATVLQPAQSLPAGRWPLGLSQACPDFRSRAAPLIDQGCPHSRRLEA